MRLPLASAAGLEHAIRVHRVLRLALGLLLAGLAVGAVVLASGRDGDAARFLPTDAGGVVVLDVSTSIGSDVSRQIHDVLGEAARSGDRFGLIVFSDTAYEALPPGTPSRELEAFRRFFDRSPSRARGATGAFASTPWSTSFTGGTKISSGLRLAREVLERDRVRDGGVVLVSDLEDDQGDYAPLAETLIGYRRDGVPLRVVGLAPAPADRALFEQLLPSGAVTEAARPGGREPADLTRSGTPTGLVLVVLLALVALAANELWCGRLVWRAAAR
jgi:hypothetical protein